MLKTQQLIELPRFTRHQGLPASAHDVRRALSSPVIESVCSFALGPEGTNIMQAASLWHAEMEVREKSKLVSCETPEEAVHRARTTTTPGMLGIYWTCAVFIRENQIFFDNPDTLPFIFQQVMPLDEMQLASTPEVVRAFNGFKRDSRILSHPSPAPLVKRLRCLLIDAHSNAEAAQRCAAGEGEFCITTETARKIHGLVTVHSFGGPPMLFLGGITQSGADLLRHAYTQSTLTPKPGHGTGLRPVAA